MTERRYTREVVYKTTNAMPSRTPPEDPWRSRSEYRSHRSRRTLSVILEHKYHKWHSYWWSGFPKQHTTFDKALRKPLQLSSDFQGWWIYGQPGISDMHDKPVYDLTYWEIFTVENTRQTDITLTWTSDGTLESWVGYGHILLEAVVLHSLTSPP